MKGIPVFKNKALYVQMINPQKSSMNMVSPEEERTEIPPWFDQAVREYGTYFIQGALVLMVAHTALKTGGTILILRTAK